MNTIIKEVTKKVNDLFIETRYKHLYQTEHGTFTSDINNNEKRKAEGKKPETYLADWKIEQHLNGTHTYGVFGTSYGSKFIAFDVDFDNIKDAKKVTLKVVNQLNELGINEEDIHVSFSGSKGFHVYVFFNKNISSKTVNRFYQLVMEKCGFNRVGQGTSYNINGGQVEQRPVATRYGVKLPLGIHRESGNRCSFVDVTNGFKHLPEHYILSVNKVDAENIYMILDEHSIEDVKHTPTEQEQVQALVEDVEKRYTPLPVYPVGIDEDVTIEAYEHLERYGMTQIGTRHNSVFKLARYYRHLGLDIEESKNALKGWMAEQDRRLYKTDWEGCMRDIDLTVEYVFEKEISIVTHKDYVSVSYEEMVEILKAKSKNQKLLLFSMLIHSKRYANKQGVFYMTYKQMNQTTTLTEKNARNNVRKLEEQDLVDIVATNQKQEGTYMKKPNRYKVNIDVTGDKVVNVECIDGAIEDVFNKVLVELIPLDYLRKNLPRRHYSEVRKLYVA